MRLRLTGVVACCVLAALLLASPDSQRASYTLPFAVPVPFAAPVRVTSAPVMQTIAPSRPDVQVPDVFKAPKTYGKSAHAPKYRVLLFNDNANLREFVARAIVTNCPLDSGDAYHVMQGAHKNGFSLVGIFVQEVAEACNEGLKTAGLSSRLEPDSD